MLRKIDILPLQVRIDATIAEVTLTDNLAYGTQFFFQNGGLQRNAVATAGRRCRRQRHRRLPGFVLAKTTSAVQGDPKRAAGGNERARAVLAPAHGARQ